MVGAEGNFFLFRYPDCWEMHLQHLFRPQKQRRLDIQLYTDIKSPSNVLIYIYTNTQYCFVYIYNRKQIFPRLDWVLKFNQRLNFYLRYLEVEKWLDKRLLSDFYAGKRSSKKKHPFKGKNNSFYEAHPSFLVAF